MAVRALVPTGYMAAPATLGGGLIVTICTGHGAVEAPVTLGGKSTQHGDGKTHDAPCAFAAVAHLAAPDLISLPLTGRSASVLQTAPAQVMPGRGLAAPPPPATGPPNPDLIAA
jgi:hypothetical protein